MKARRFTKLLTARRLFWLLAVLALGIFLARGFFKADTTRADSSALPTIKLESLEGKSIELSSFEGKPLVINLWATWCGPCRRELPLFVEMAKTRPDTTFLFVNQKESREQVEAFLQEQTLQLEHVLLDTRGVLTTEFDVFGLPSTFFFDAQGKLVSEHTGELSSVQLFNTLTDLARP